MPRSTLALLIFFACGCTPRAPSAGSPSVQRSAEAASEARCSYEVRVPAGPPWALDVTARCEGAAITAFRAPSRDVAAVVRAQPPRASTQGVLFPVRNARPDRAELDYRVDLGVLAERAGELDVASHFGASLLAPASSFLLAPEPDPNGAPVDVRFTSDAPFATGLRRATTGYAIETHELRVATYTGFGVREQRTIPAGGTRFHLARLDGPLATPFDALAAWIEKAGRAVNDFYGAPVDSDVTIFLAPLPGRRGIPFGKLLPESGPGVVVLAGEHTSEPELYRDWVLVHELFHLGSPSYLGEGKWFDEGLATYFEPLIRARAGFITEADVWAEFITSMPRGLPVLAERGLENSETYADTYWGGAVFCLLADVEIRRQSDGRVGLEDGMRAVLAKGGNSSEVWALARALAVADAAFGAPVLAPLAERHARRAHPVDLPALFRDLGVSLDQDGAVRFDDTAKLASVRRALSSGEARTELTAP